jgi:hypothetical protein
VRPDERLRGPRLLWGVHLEAEQALARAYELRRVQALAFAQLQEARRLEVAVWIAWALAIQ